MLSKMSGYKFKSVLDMGYSLAPGINSFHAAISLSSDHAAFAGLVDGRHSAGLPVSGCIYLQYRS